MVQNPYQPGNADLNENTTDGKGGFLSVLKKILIGLGVIFGLIVLLLIWAGITGSNTHGKFENIAEPYIKEFLTDQSPWNYELAKPHLSLAWLEVTKDEQGVRV